MNNTIPYILTFSNVSEEYAVSSEIQNLTGFSSDVFKNPDFVFERIHRDDKTKFLDFQKIIKSGNRSYLEFRFEKSNNKYIWIHDRINSSKVNNKGKTVINGEWTFSSKPINSLEGILDEESVARQLFDASTSAYIVLDFEMGKIIDFNESVMALYECKTRSKFFKSLNEFVNEKNTDVLPLLKSRFDEAREKGKSIIEIEAKKISGKTFYASIVFKLIVLNTQKFILGIVSDISDKKQAEDLAQYRFNLEKLVYEISAKFINVASYEVDNQIVKSFEKVCDFTDSYATYIYLYRDIRREIELTHCWIRNYNKDIEAEYKWISLGDNDWHYNEIHDKQIVLLQPEKSEEQKSSNVIKRIGKLTSSNFLHIALTYQGNIIGFIGISSQDNNRKWNKDDIQLLQMLGENYVSALQRKEAIKVLLEGERTYREIYNSTTDAIMVLDSVDWVISDVNQAFTDMFGYNYAEYPDISLAEICCNEKEYSPNELEKFLSSASETTKTKEWHTRDKNGNLFWTEISIKTAEIHGVNRILCVLRDISGRIKSESLIRNSEERFRSIVQQLSDIVFILDSSGIITYTTPSLENILNIKEQEIQGKDIRTVIAKEDIAVFEELYSQILKDSTKIKQAEIRLRNSDEKYHTFEVVGNNMLEHQAINGVVLTCKDITSRKEMENRILDAVIKTEERERELFAKNLHDDLGPLLSSLKMYLGMLKKLKEEEKRTYVNKQLEDILKEAIQTTKNVSNDLSPHVLTNYGIASAIEQFINKLTSHLDIQFENGIEGLRYDPRIEHSVYRIAKELINNSIKHSNANVVVLKLKEKGTKLNFKYTDGGKGFSTDKMDEYLKKGMGLSNIISRAKSLKATYKFSSPKNGGFAFEMQVPLL